MPDVLGMTLEEAEQYLRNAGVAFIVEETKPLARPKGRKYLKAESEDISENIMPEYPRVIGLRNKEEILVLITCHIADPFM